MTTETCADTVNQITPTLETREVAANLRSLSAPLPGADDGPPSEGEGDTETESATKTIKTIPELWANVFVHMSLL